MSVTADYFLIERENNDQYPLLAFANAESDKLFHKAQRESKFVNTEYVMQLRLGKPIPKKYIMADMHSLPAPVLSKRIKNVIDQFAPQNTQLIPSNVSTSNGILDYFLLHTSKIECLNKESSLLNIGSNGEIFEAKTLALDIEVLKDIPLQNRMIFLLHAGIDYYLIEERLVEAIRLINPLGIRFIPISEWNSDYSFA